MLESITERLKSVEGAFMKASSRDASGLSEFYRDLWLPLTEDIQKGPNLDEETARLWDIVASRVALMSEHFLETHARVSRVKADCLQDLDDVFAKYEEELECSEVRQPGPNSRETNTPYQRQYLEAVYHWLRKNLHNPYPSREVRNDIAHETNTRIQVIDSWFVEIRRKIGWNSLRKKHFSNKRAQIVEAASQFYLGTGTPTDQDATVGFTAIRRRVTELCAQLHRQKPSEEATYDVVPPTIPLPTSQPQKITDHPSPAKRRRTSEFDGSPRLPKRTRRVSSSSESYSSASCSQVDIQTPTSSRPSTPSTGPPTPPDRKRRPSESEEIHSKKRPRYNPPQPCVVGAGSLSFDLDADWFHPSSTVPTVLDEPLVDVQLFDYGQICQDLVHSQPFNLYDTGYLSELPILDLAERDFLPDTLLPDSGTTGISNLHDIDSSTYSTDEGTVTTSTSIVNPEVLNQLEYRPPQSRIASTDGWRGFEAHCWQDPFTVPVAGFVYPEASPMDSAIPGAALIPTNLASSPTRTTDALMQPASLATKAEKQRRLAEIQEEARRLQSELAQL